MRGQQNPQQMPPGGAMPPWANDSQRIDVNLIAMLLWQALLTGSAVTISHMGWYLPDANSGEMGLQYGLITSRRSKRQFSNEGRICFRC